VTGLNSVYLISGEDDAKIDAWRARLRKRAEEEGGPGALETFDARETTPEALAAELAALTFNPGRRMVRVSGKCAAAASAAAIMYRA